MPEIDRRNRSGKLHNSNDELYSKEYLNKKSLASTLSLTLSVCLFSICKMVKYKCTSLVVDVVILF